MIIIKLMRIEKERKLNNFWSRTDDTLLRMDIFVGLFLDTVNPGTNSEYIQTLQNNKLILMNTLLNTKLIEYSYVSNHEV